MNQVHAQKKLRRMDTANLIRIQEARVRRKKAGWSKFVLRVLAHRNADQAKWSLPHIPPRSKREWIIEDSKRRAKNRDDLISMLRDRKIDEEIITAIVGAGE